MTTLCATGKTVGAFTGKTYDAYLWAYGSYKYEIEVKITTGFCDCEVMRLAMRMPSRSSKVSV